jgi:hypothetical protein
MEGMKIFTDSLIVWNGHSRHKGNYARFSIYFVRSQEIYSYFWVSNNTVLSHQKGVFRVNCIDCLDRTNVVQVGSRALLALKTWSDSFFQSAFARFVLNKQLGALALLNPTNSGRTDADLSFNDGMSSTLCKENSDLPLHSLGK